MRWQSPVLLSFATMLMASPMATAAPLPVRGHVDSSATPSPVAVRLVRLPAAAERARLALAGLTRPEPTATVSVGRDGSFQLLVPEPGMWRVVAEPYRGLPMEIDLVPLTEPAELPPLALVAAREVSVRVLGASGQPLPGAVVSILPAPKGESSGPAWVPASRAAITRGDGTAVLTLGPAKASRLVVTAPGQIPAEIDPPAGAEITVRLDPGSARTLIVRDSQGQEGANTVVMVDGFPTGTTGNDGRLTVATRPGQTARLEAFAPDGRRGWAELPPSPAATVSLRIEKPSRLAGRVLALPGRRPLADALVWTAEDPGAAVRTRADGGYDLPLSGGEPARLQAAARGYAMAALPGPAPGTRAGFTFTLHPAVALASGRVLDANERPVQSAEVTLLPSSFGADAESLVAGPEIAPRATTGPNGRFQFERLPVGRWDLHVTARGFLAVTVNGVDIPSGKATADLGTVLLKTAATLTGRVVGPGGQPVAGARVARLNHDPAATRLAMAVGSPSLAVLSAADGLFELGGLTPGEPLDLRVEREGFRPVTLSDVETGAERPPLEVRLEPASRLRGRVQDEAGDPVEGARVLVLMPRSAEPRIMATAAADARGAFEIYGLKPGPVRVTALADGWLPAPAAEAEIPADGAPSEVELLLARGAALEGVVTGPDGLPAASATVRAVRETPGLPLPPGVGAPETTTDGDGRYRLEGLPEGPVRISAAHADHAPALREIDVQPGSNRLDLEFGRGLAVAGRVVDADGTVLAGVTVEIRPEAGPGRVQTATTGPDGEFRFGSVAEGQYGLTTSAPGGTAHATVRVSGTPVSGVELRLVPGGTIAGSILGIDPAMLARVEIVATGPGRGRTVRPGFDGRYVLEGLESGDWHVVARDGAGRETRANGRIEAGVSELLLDLRFERGQALTGLILSEGTPVAGALIAVQGTDGPGGGGTMTGADGRFRIDHLPAGTYDVTVLRRDNGTQTVRRIDLRTEEELVLDLPPPPPSN